MRIKLSLQPLNRRAHIPINYQYPLSAAIYKILKQTSPEYANFLHNRGYPAPSGRLMKLFTFSKLWIPGVRRKDATLSSNKNAPWELQVSSPMLEEFVQTFVLGLFESAEISIGAQGLHASFRIDHVEALPMPDFRETVRCKCLSPIVVSTKHEHGGRVQPYYYRPSDEGISDALLKNLLQKHEIIHGRAPSDERLQFRLETCDRPNSKLITLKEGTREATRIKAFETHFTLEGNTELIQTAYECGLGEHNSQGFGMIDTVGLAVTDRL